MIKMLVGITLFALLGTHSYAFNPTEKTVNIVIPFAPGGGVDNTFKNLQKFAEGRGIKLHPVFKPGADSVIGTQEISSSPADGFHLGISTASGIALYNMSRPNNNIVIVTGVQTTAQVVVAHTKSKIKNFNTLKKELRETPGVTIALGNPGQRIMWDQILELAHIKTQPTFVPYKGAGQIVSNVIGGHVELTYLPTTVLKSQVDAGNLIPLAVTYPVSDWPNVPVLSSTFKSWKDYEFGHVLYAPSGTSPEIVKYWANFIKEYIEHPDTKEEFKKNYIFALPQGQQIAEERIESIKPKLSNILNKDKEKFK
jgi:tripartite-type tricarboxylate transporter receptor subunit TctC